MTAKDVILEVVFPILGGIVGFLMFASPIKAVLRARRERVLGVGLKRTLACSAHTDVLLV